MMTRENVAGRPERRSVTGWSLLTVTFWMAPLVASWPGISMTRAILAACAFRLTFFHGTPVTLAEDGLWGLAFVTSMAKNSRDLRLGFGTVFGRRSADAPESLPPQEGHRAKED